MITYNPKDWFRLIFQFHRSDTFRILLPTMVLLGAATGGVVYMQQNGYAQIRTSTVFHQILGFALSMLLVFRINTAYERWWEGRRLWGSNDMILVPTYNDVRDRVALGILAELVPDRKVIGIHCGDWILGGGTLHCSTQQEPDWTKISR